MRSGVRAHRGAELCCDSLLGTGDSDRVGVEVENEAVHRDVGADALQARRACWDSLGADLEALSAIVYVGRRAAVRDAAGSAAEQVLQDHKVVVVGQRGYRRSHHLWLQLFAEVVVEREWVFGGQELS